MIHPLLKEIDTLDFRNAELTGDFGNLFIICANQLGWGIKAEIAAPVRSEMLKIGKKWLIGVKINQRHYSPAEGLTILSVQDLIYRIVWNAVPDPKDAFVVVNKALEAYIHGDMNVDIYLLYQLIENGLYCDRNRYIGKPLEWLSIMLERWHKEFCTGRYFDPKSLKIYDSKSKEKADSDILNRVAILLDSNLSAYVQDQMSFKKHLFDNHRHYVDDLINGGANNDKPTLTALCNFIRSSYSVCITLEERDAYLDAVYSALSEVTDSPYMKAAIELLSEQKIQEFA